MKDQYVLSSVVSSNSLVRGQVMRSPRQAEKVRLERTHSAEKEELANKKRNVHEYTFS